MKRLLALTLLAAAAQAHALREEVVTLPTRPGVTESYLVVRGSDAAPKVAIVSFVGGAGAIDFARRVAAGPVAFEPSANFLIRARDRFAAGDAVVAIVDAPSDELPGGMRDAFRLGPEHASDVRAVVADLRRRFPQARVFLVGTSRGTISAAALAARLGETIDGVVLSSTVTVANRAGPGLSGFDFATIRVPVLLVHHRDDGCVVSPYHGVARLSPPYPLVTAHGGDAPLSGPCEPQSPHGYFGLDAPVVAAIRAWMEGREFPRDVP